MGSSIGARNRITSILNANVLDPYPGTRNGNQFYDEGTGINLNRAQTYPKGFIQINPKSSSLSGFGGSGNSPNSVEINIWYFVKEKISYDDGSIVYKNEDYVSYMTDLIEKSLRSNITLGSDYHIKNFGSSEGPKTGKEGSFKVYYDVVPVTVYWNEVY